ncbi:ComEC/Rec2-related protein [Desulfobacca acetoxidans DSM 11109]|uniref:ComEC/Rec2-related protein n=1 Tax=Desulfobacca acetoxidans (strain ATCC 700848 / DSM 11109 / ASRB2) TaxID=880072 RepID=F2NBX5_DESAR|nr:ComEC/Rec2-related protein [Desulfobacca acetoxidans DSM 11109]
MMPGVLWSRPLASLTLALTAGIASPALGLTLPKVWTSTLVAALILLLVICCWRRLSVSGTIGLALFWLLGQGFYQAALEPAHPPCHVRFLPQNVPLTIIGIMQSQPAKAIEGYRLELKASSWSAGGAWQPAEGKILVQGLTEAPALVPGARVAMRLRLRPVEELLNPGSSRRRVALARQGIFTSASLCNDLQPVRLASRASVSWSVSWREAAQAYCRGLLDKQPQPARAVYKALLLGDQSEISRPLWQALGRTGTSHVISVSGLHLGLISGFCFCLIFWLLRRSAWLLQHLNAIKWSVAFSIPPVLVYAWLAGWSAATQRSALMIVAFLILLLLDRHRDLYSILALAAFIILMTSPLQFYSLSFQLSFLSVWGLIYLSPKLLWPWQKLIVNREEPPTIIKKIILWSGRALSTSVAATLATLPIVVASFHQAPTYGIVINLLAIPLIGGVVLPLGFIALLTSFLPLPCAAGMLWLGRFFLETTLRAIEWASSWPGVVLPLPSPTPWQTAAYFLTLISLLGLKQQPWRWIGTSLGVLLLTGSLIWTSLSDLRKPHLEITALDTYREIAVAATLPGAVVLVINAGEPGFRDYPARFNAALLSYLHWRQIRTVDCLAALTVTKENAGTLLAVAKDFQVKQFWYGGGRPLIPDFWKLKNRLGDDRREVQNLSLRPMTLDIGGAQVQTSQLREDNQMRPNGPVLLRLAYQGHNILVAPPLTTQWRQQCPLSWLVGTDVWILPGSELHHDFWQDGLLLLRPKIVVATGPETATAGLASSGMPGVHTYVTRQGAVTLRIDSQGVRVEQWRPQ